MRALAGITSLLFQGDSITDSGRKDSPDGFGFGYVAIIAGALASKSRCASLRVMNRGVGGDRTAELLARWDEDCVALKPEALSLMAGVNDVWRLRGEWNGQTYIPPDRFKANYEELIDRARSGGVKRLILMSPTTIENEKDGELSALLDEEAAIVRGIAKRTKAVYVGAREEQKRVISERPDFPWTTDGCHPSLAGHALIALTWLRAAGG
jgi:acyl-CoA thioesterase I